MARLSTVQRLSIKRALMVVTAIRNRLMDGLIVRLHGIEFAMTGYNPVDGLATIENPEGRQSRCQIDRLTIRKGLSF